MPQFSHVLGIESSCDEMAAAVVHGSREILASVVHGQAEVHRPYGGVVPELASRDHVRAVSWVVEGALREAGLAAEALVNPNTVGKAYRELEVLGVVAGRNGAGVFVTPEGPDTARTERRQATLAALHAAVEAALAAGHDAALLRAAVAQRLGGAEGTEGAKRRRAS